MAFTINYLAESRVIEICYIGELSKSELVESLFKAGELGKEKLTTLVLTDCTKMTGGHSFFDLYDLFALFEEAQVDHRLKESIVFDAGAPVTEVISFFETAALNRGYNVRIFTDREVAMAWLLQGEA